MDKDEALDLALDALYPIAHNSTDDPRGQAYKAITAIKQARSAPVQEPVGVYGHCPICGAKGVTRERRPDGDDRCANGHTYKSMHATTPPAAQPAPVQEPVAWRTFDGEGGYDYRTYDMNEGYAKEWNERNPNHKGWVEALYTTPPAAQRQWVGLTDEEIEKLRESFATRYAIEAIEAKLRSKNNG